MQVEKVIKIIGKILSSIVVLLIIFTAVYPIVFVIFSAFKPGTEFASNFWLPPRHPTLDNFREVWFQYKFYNYFINSLFVTILASTGTVCMATMAGYALAKLRLKYSEVVFYVIIGALFMPVYIYIIPLYNMMKTIGLLNTLPNLILVYMFFELPVSIYIMRNFFLAIPKDLQEAAIIDGASQWRVFLEIMVPLAAPAIGTISIFTFLNNWGEYIWVTISNPSDKARTIPAALAYFTSQYNVFWENQMMALAIALIPVITVYLIFQRFFTRGIISGALKE